jgi:predicted glutamine amidotransferase
MSVDKHTLQQWVAGAEMRFRKSHKPLAALATIPLINKLGSVADTTMDYVHTEKLDLTRARDFHAQETSEDILIASMQLPFLGKRGIGNDTGMAVASFHYTDSEGDEHNVIAICAYTITGLVSKTRELKQVITIPMA